MAYNKGLSQQEKDRINAEMRARLAQGQSKEEVDAWVGAEVENARAAGKTNPTAGQDAPAVDGGSASGDGSLAYRPETNAEFAQTAGKKRPRVDEDGEVINLAQDFGAAGAFVESIPFIGDLIDDMYGAAKSGWAQGQTVDDALALFTAGEDADPETIQKYIEAVRNQQDQPVSQEMRDFNAEYESNGGGAWGFVKAIAQNPSVGATTMVSSLVAMLNPASAAGAGIGAAGGAAVAGSATLGIGAGVGAVAGTFAGAGGVLETGTSFTEFLQEELAAKKLDFDEAGIAEVLGDKDALLRIRAKSAARGGVIAVIDGLTGGLAGKAAAGVGKTAVKAAKLKATLASVAIEGAGGGLGEAAARAVVGQEMDAREIGLEIVGEFGTGIAIAKAGVTQPSYEIGGQRVNKDTAMTLIKDAPEMADTLSITNDPEVQAEVDKAVSGIENINENKDHLTDNDNKIRQDKLSTIKSLQTKQREATDDNSKAVFQEGIDEARSELREIIKEQNAVLKHMPTEDRGIITNNKAVVDRNTDFIDAQTKKYEGSEIPADVQALIETKKEQNNELTAQMDEVRGMAEIKRQEAVAIAQKREAKKQEAVQEEVVEQDPAAAVAAQQDEQITAEVDEIVSEEVDSNGKILEKLEDETLAEYVEIAPIGNSEATINSAEDYIPLTKADKNDFGPQDFGREINTLQPLDVAVAKQIVKKIQKAAKQMGAETDAKAIQDGDGTWRVAGTITSAKRPTNLRAEIGAKVKEEAPAAAEEAAPVEAQEDHDYSYGGVSKSDTLPTIDQIKEDEGFQQDAVLDYLTNNYNDLVEKFNLTPEQAEDIGSIEEVTQYAEDQAAIEQLEDLKEDLAKRKPKERTADDYVADIAKKHKSKVDKDSGEFTTPDQRTAYNILGGLKKRGHKDAFIYDSEDGKGYRVNPGERTVDKDTPQYSVEEGPSQEDIQYELDLLSAPGQTIDQAIEEGITNAQTLYDNDDLVFEKANNLYPSDQETGAYNEEGHDSFLEALQDRINERIVSKYPKGTATVTPDGTIVSDVEAVYREDLNDPYELRASVQNSYGSDRFILYGNTNEYGIGDVDGDYGGKELGMDKHEVRGYVDGLTPVEFGYVDANGETHYFDSRQEMESFAEKNPNQEEGPQFSVSEDVHDRMLYDIAEGIGTYGDQNSHAIFDSIWDEYADDFNNDERAYEEAYNEAYDYATENPSKYIDSLSDYAATVESEPGYKTDEESQERVKRAHDEIDRFASTIEMSVPDDIFNEWSDSFDYVAEDINDMSPEELAKYDNLYELISDHDFSKYAWAIITDVMESKGFYGSVDPNVEADKKSEAMDNVYEKVHDYITNKVDDSNPLKAKEQGPQFSVDEASAPENFTQHANLREVSGNRIKMNIGLENNPIDNINGIIKKLQSDKRVRLGTTEQVTGEYEGNPERTVVVDAKFDGTASQFRDYIEKLNADLTQEAIGVQFNGRGSLIYDPKFKGDRYKFDSEYFVQPSGGKKKVFGVDEKDLLVEAGPGQRYEKITLEQASRGSAALAGGKGGFASGGDARESVGQLTEADKKANEAARKAAAALGKVHNLPVGQPLSSEERSQALSSVRELARSWKWIQSPSGLKTKKSLAPTEGNISYGVGKDGVAMTGNKLTQADVDYLNDQYDKLAGYKGAHNHPDRNYRIGVVNDLNKPQRRGAKRPKTPLSGNKPGQITFKGGSRTVDFPITPSRPEKNIILGKDVKEREGTGQFEESFDRRDIGPEERTTLRQNIGKQPKVDEAFVKKYNAGKIGGRQLIESMTPFILNRQRNQELQGYAVEKFTEQVKAGKLKGKSVKQIFGAARQIADGAATLRNETLGQSRDYQALRNKVRRAEQAFYAENGYEPSNSEIADYLNDNKSKYRVKDDVKVAEVEDAKFDELPEVELGGVQGTTRDKAQTRIAKEAGLDQLTDAVLGPVVSDKVDAAVSRILRGAPVKPSKGKFTDQAPRRGAKFDVKGDKTAAGISKSNTEINKDIQAGIMDFVTASAIRDNFSAIKDIMNIPQESYNDLSKSQKLDLRRKIARGLAAESEARLGKTPGEATPSAQFSSIENLAKAPKPANKALTDRIIEQLQSVFPFAEVVTDMRRISREVRGFGPQHKGAMWGGNVYLNTSKMTEDTALHEFTHIFMDDIAALNRPFFEKGKDLFKDSKLYHDTKKRYPKLTGEALWKEVLTNAVGKHGTKLFNDKKKAGTWDRWVAKFKKLVKDRLGIQLDKDFNDLTLGEWLDAASLGALTNTSNIVAPSKAAPQFSVSEDLDADPDMAAARLRNKQSEKKWYNPKSWIGKLIPPAADDYHGLVSRLKIPGIKSVTDAFIKNHQDHIEKVTKAREQISSITKRLGTPLDKVVTKFKGADLTAAQAIQAHMDGFPNEFSRKPKVQSYIKAMSDLGVLTPSPEKAYDLASPASDIYQYLNTKLYKESFKDFNAKKSQVFSPKVMEKISNDHGEKYAKALTLALQRMSSGKNSGTVMDKTTQKWNDWALGSVGTIMFLNFRSAALQMMSVANFGFDTKSPGKFIANFFDPGTYAEAKKLFNSAYLKERRERAGFDVNAAEMMDQLKNSKTFSEFTKSVLKKGFAATSLVDSMAIAMGGASFIKAQVDSGVSRSEAIKQWKEATEEAQQSARPDRVSQWQTEGVSKFILAFANTPQQYFRLAQKAARTIRNPKASLSDKKRAFAKIGYYMVAQNMLFSMAQAASLALIGGGDDEQKTIDGLNSMSSTILRGMGLYGAIIDSGKNVIMEAVKQEGKANPDHVKSVLKATGIAPPLNRKIQDLLTIGRAHNYNNKDKWETTIAKGVAATTNLPTDWAQKKYNAIMGLWDDQFSAYQKLLIMMGWSKWSFKDSEKGSDFGDESFESGGFDDGDFESEDF